MIGALVAASGGNIRTVIADGAYDGEPTYNAIRAARPTGSPPKIVIPLKAPSIPDKGDPHGGSERKRHTAEIARHGRMAWQRRHGYGKRSLAETAFSRIKTINDGRLTSRTSAPSRTRSPFTSRSPTETCSLRAGIRARPLKTLHSQKSAGRLRAPKPVRGAQGNLRPYRERAGSTVVHSPCRLPWASINCTAAQADRTRAPRR